jgi:ribosome recycling factor
VKTQDTYKEIKTFHFPGMVVRVHIPDLTEEERNARMKSIHKQAAILLKKVNA